MPYSRWHALLKDERYSASSVALRSYLALTDGMESPTPFHIWSFLSMMSALAGGRIYFDHGAIGKKKLNLAVVLTGFPAIRKSTAITVMESFSHGLPLQYGPSDTSGQRQGIMAAMLPRWQYDHAEQKDEFGITPDSLKALAELDTSSIMAALPSRSLPPASELYFTSKELGRLFASTTGHDLINFFTDAIDGESVYYQIKTQAIRIRSPLINLLGATTPGNLSSILPRGATEHGLLSRILFVYADRLAASNPIPQAWSPVQVALKDKLLSQIEETLERVDGVLEMSESAEKTYRDIYNYNPRFNDVRLQAYVGRRADHLVKVAGALCLSRGAPQQQITASDVRLAHGLIILTEALMPRAFLGLDPRPSSKFHLGLVEYLESQPNQKADKELCLKQLAHIGGIEDLHRWTIDLATQARVLDNGKDLSLPTLEIEKAWNTTNAIFKGANRLDDFFPQMRSANQPIS